MNEFPIFKAPICTAKSQHSFFIGFVFYEFFKESWRHTIADWGHSKHENKIKESYSLPPENLLIHKATLHNVMTSVVTSK